MKTLKLYLIAGLAAVTITANAQLKVDNTGKVGASAGTSVLNAHLQVGDVTNFNSYITAIGSDFRIGCYNSGAPYAFVSARDFSTRSIGMVLRVQNSGNINNAFTILPNGNIGIGNGFAPAYNLDVLGTINASGPVRAASFVSTSDKRLKDNIKSLSFSTVALLMNLQGVSYKLNAGGVAGLAESLNPEYAVENDSVNPKSIIRSEDTAFYNRNHMGFLAQDLQKVFPELVYADKDGILSIDYIGLIPVLVESIKDLNNSRIQESINYTILEKKLTELENRINQCCDLPALKSAQTDIEVLKNQAELPALYQNAPNPFNKNTSISYYLPTTIESANLYIYNMQGVQLKVYPINDRTNGNIIINGSEFIPGMYIYTLVADGKEVDTKRMILTN